MKYWDICCLILLFFDMMFKKMVFVYDIEFESCNFKIFYFIFVKSKYDKYDCVL